jgi:hypothetical protein
MSNSNDLIQKLKDYNNDNLIPIFIPSLSKKLKFKPLTIKQQKNIIKTAGDGVISGATLSQVINNIVNELCVESDQEFSIIDRYPVILAARMHSVGDEIDVGSDKVSIKEHIAICNDTFKGKTYDETTTCSLQDITINLKIPSLKRDSVVSDKFTKNAKDNGVEIGDAVATLYVHEIVKFISSIENGDDVLDFYKMSILDCVKIVESLPISTNKKIIDYIESIRDIENLYLETSSGDIEIDASFFSVA